MIQRFFYLCLTVYVKNLNSRILILNQSWHAQLKWQKATSTPPALSYILHTTYNLSLSFIAWKQSSMSAKSI